MLTGRLLDAEMRSLYDRKTPMPRKLLYTGKGQEGAAAIAALLKQDDYLFPHPYRGFTHLLAKGVPLDKILGEYMGKRTGMLQGFGDVGGFYWAPDHGISGVSTVLGGNFSIVCGLGLASKKSGTGRIVAIFFGDGEASRTTFGSALNLASTWKLPVLFVCENNGLAISAPLHKTSATPNISDRGAGYGVRSITFDGANIFKLLDQSSAIIEDVRSSSMPALIEVLTPRFQGHFYAEDRLRKNSSRAPRTTIRPDPLLQMEQELQARGLLSLSDLEALRTESARQIHQAAEDALRAPTASLEEFASFYHE